MISHGLIGTPPKDTSRKALEHVTIMKLYELIGTIDGKRSGDLDMIALAIVDKYIEENKA